MFSSIFIASAILPGLVLGQVTGSATGFASGVTGGGYAEPVTPKTIEELEGYLTDSEPRVILVDHLFDFTAADGNTTDDGCRPDSNTCPGMGQDALDGPDWCSPDYPVVTVTYNNAAGNPIRVASDKSLVGVGSEGVLKGKGLYLTGDVSNIIIQNIHITDLNPQYIWGGDAITLVGTDMVWIDHCKFSLIGRQMIVSGYQPAGRVTISNTEFDGETSWSASCNNDHYWTMLLLGEDDQITLMNNYFHDVSGRAPKIGSEGAMVVHAVNNLFSNNQGHDFDVATGGNVLIEGNVFSAVDTPIFPPGEDTGNVFSVPEGSESECVGYLGRDCIANALTNSGEWPVYDSAEALSAMGNNLLVEPMEAIEVEEYVLGNAGIGLL